MKKSLSLLLIFAMLLALTACGGSGDNGGANGEGGYKVAMITDYADITDQSFNQTTWEACVKFGEQTGTEVRYYKPVSEDTAGRVAMIDLAIAEGYNIIVMPGYAFGAAIYEVQDVYPDIKFVALDVSEFDVFDCFYNHDENGNWTTLIDENNPAHIGENVYCAIYQEELCGYMAGYAAVKLGYTKLGYLGGMAVPAVQRFGYGFVQGADAAAGELGVDVEVKYAYGNQFHGDADLTAVMDTWYATGTQAVFACGGSIWTSVAEAAKKAGGKVIGVDTDQAGKIDGDYGEGMTITSAMKGLAPATIDTLTEIVINGNWAKYSGKVESLGLASEDPAANYVQLAPSTQFAEGKFTTEDYAALVKGMLDGSIMVSNDTSTEPTVNHATVIWLGNLK